MTGQDANHSPVVLNYEMGDHVTAFSTTRKGGVSKGNYAELNINHYCGDDEESIRRNKKLLAEKIGIEADRIIMPHQVHKTLCVDIDEDFMSQDEGKRKEMLEGIDALTTRMTGLCIGVSTADCVPVLLYDDSTQTIAAIHAGWRGTAGRITEKTVRHLTDDLGCNAGRMKAAIGPSIGIDSFEVGDEVYEQFAKEGFDMKAIARRYKCGSGQETGEKWHIDLWECNRRQLLAQGLNDENIDVAGICTYKNHERFFSARRLGISSGRIFTGIMIKGK